MDIEDYARWAGRVAGVAPDTAPSAEKLSYLGLGLAGESGEAVEHIKKRLRDGELDQQALAELGDVAYYWAALCLACGRSPGDVLAASRAKIEARLADGG